MKSNKAIIFIFVIIIILISCLFGTHETIANYAGGGGFFEQIQSMFGLISATDEIQVPRAERGSCVHFTGTGFIDLANAWNIALSQSFFNNSLPNIGFLPTIIPKFSNRSYQTELSFAEQYSSYL